MENNQEMMHKEAVQEGGFVSQKIPKVSIEILIGGVQEDKDKIGAFLDELNKQINEFKEAKKRVRVLYHLRPETMSKAEQDRWLRDKANSVYMIFAPEDRKVSAIYIKTLVKNIKNFEESLKWIQVRKVEFKSTYEKTKQSEAQVKAEPEVKQKKVRTPKAAK
jgi:hypothetical protein